MIGKPSDFRRVPGFSRARRSGFTLVELMVALGLSAMIAVSIMMISTQAQVVYDVTTRKVEVYNKFRFAFLSIEKDFSRWINTSNLEYFVDGRGGRPTNEHWDDGEELPDTSDERGPGVLDGGIRGTYDEFASIVERHYFEILENGSRKVHDAFQAYFRTMTYVDGRTREANIEYMLLDPNLVDSRGNPLPPTEVQTDRLKDLTLFKIIRFNDISYDQIQKPSANFPIKRRYVEVCTNITDFRVEYAAENRFDPQSGAGTGFYTPLEDFNKPPEPDLQPIRDASNGDIYRKLFGYGTGNVKPRGQRATAYRAIFGDRGGARQDHRPFRFGFERDPKVRFAELTPGDRIFTYNEGQRGGGAAGGGANAGVAGRVNAGASMPSGTYTVKSNIGGRLEFVEPVESSTWGRDVTGNRYKASYLPQALRITIRVIDDREKVESDEREARTLQRVVWVRQKAR